MGNQQRAVSNQSVFTAILTTDGETEVTELVQCPQSKKKEPRSEGGVPEKRLIHTNFSYHGAKSGTNDLFNVHQSPAGCLLALHVPDGDRRKEREVEAGTDIRS